MAGGGDFRGGGSSTPLSEYNIDGQGEPKAGIPTEEEFGGGGSPFGEINYEGSKQGAVIPGAAAQAEQEVDANAFAPTKSFST